MPYYENYVCTRDKFFSDKKQSICCVLECAKIGMFLCALPAFVSVTKDFNEWNTYVFD